jgi:RHS repeat-associated protein
MNVGGDNFTYGYDESGNRLEKYGSNTNDAKEYYLRDQTGKELAVYTTGTNTIKMINLYGNGLIGKVDAGGNNYYYIKDHLGSIRSTIGATGAPLSAQDYYAYGGILNFSVAGDNRYKFTGKQRDDETNYDYFGARYYNSEFGGWLSVDPMADFHPGENPYLYCKSDPINLIDLFGLDTLTMHQIKNDQDGLPALAVDQYTYAESKQESNPLVITSEVLAVGEVGLQNKLGTFSFLNGRYNLGANGFTGTLKYTKGIAKGFRILGRGISAILTLKDIEDLYLAFKTHDLRIITMMCAQLGLDAASFMGPEGLALSLLGQLILESYYTNYQVGPKSEFAVPDLSKTFLGK